MHTTAPAAPAPADTRLWVADEEGGAWHLPRPQQPGRVHRARCGLPLDSGAPGVPSAELRLWGILRCPCCAAHGRR